MCWPYIATISPISPCCVGHRRRPFLVLPSARCLGVPGYIHYLPRSNSSHLSLIQGEGDTFAGIIGLLSEYESVLDRHESLAASLGAKLTGPRLLRGIEKFFDGPIKTTPLQPFSNTISWLDVVSYARSNPKEFSLTHKPDGSRWCQFHLNGVQVEIMEDDWRLVWSSALDRFPLDQPLEEDEAAELATLDILEQRTSILYKKADEVAARARILNHRLGHRKQDIHRYRNAQEGSSSRFHAVNSNQRGSKFNQAYDLHADLLQQFVAATASPPPSRATSNSGMPVANVPPRSPSHSASHVPQAYAHTSSSSRYGAGGPAETPGQPVVDSRADAFRSIITQRTDQLGKGEVINPPCDRCRRLKVQCVKHLTACVGCTKKHAKCSWKTVTEEEMGRLRQEMTMKGGECADGEDDGGSDASEAREVQASRLGNGQETGPMSSETTPGTAGSTTKDGGSQPPSREGGRLATLEPPTSISMSRFDLSAERHRLSLSVASLSGTDAADRSSDFPQPSHGPPMIMAMASTTTGANAPRSSDGSLNASPS
ncbi:hypothetical protein B0J13DRAFT_192280 [Dactylonectria estremocensis]|uniref:Zn(2)-C6 fungal-type domain-containing protein n=1 Tax=Dactylonectria estremocensis TaxID=1079267 RepID=A0A9P9FDZ5_9HYPO|nr:hypothetical protein B0J13DRAFT_192280 [Dactylonectria estremocensis]